MEDEVSRKRAAARGDGQGTKRERSEQVEREGGGRGRRGGGGGGIVRLSLPFSRCCRVNDVPCEMPVFGRGVIAFWCNSTIAPFLQLDIVATDRFLPLAFVRCSAKIASFDLHCPTPSQNTIDVCNAPQ